MHRQPRFHFGTDVGHAGTGPGQVAYMVLFNQWTQYQMWPSTIQPQTWAAYKAVF